MTIKVLITGSSGQVGRALVERLRQQTSDYIVLAPQRAELDLLNTTAIQDFVLNNRPAIIINPAAYTAVDLAEDDAETAYRVNAEAPQALAEAAAKLGIPLIHFSTDYVFDGEKRDQQGQLVPYHESDACAPIGVYGASKRAGELAVMQSGCRHIILRTSWVYSDFGKNFMLTMLRLAAEREQLSIVNDQWGAPTSALWIAEACIDIMQQALRATYGEASSTVHLNTSTESTELTESAQWWRTHGGVLHLTPRNWTNWQQFAAAIMQQAHSLQLINKLPEVKGIPAAAYPTRAKRPSNSMLNTARLRDLFNIEAPLWEDGLQACLRRVYDEKTKTNTDTGKGNGMNVKLKDELKDELNDKPTSSVQIPYQNPAFRLLGDERGSLIAVEANKDVPFEIARVYYIFGTKDGVERGFHAHRALKQVAVAVRGSCIMKLDDGQEQIDILMNDPAKSVYIAPMVWHEMREFSEDCVLLVFADQGYDESDYIRNYDAFMEAVKFAKKDAVTLSSTENNADNSASKE